MSEKENMLELLWYMQKIRMVQEKIADEYSNQEMRCPVHLCIGQEAIPVGICANLKDSDVVMSHHRSHGHYLAKGGSIKGLIAELYGKKSGCSGGWGGSQHLIDESVGFLGSTAIIGGTIPVATGAAFAKKLGGETDVVVSFFGDSVVEEGVFYESINFAALHKLPIIYACENNLYSVHTAIKDRQPDRPLYQLGKSFGIKSLQVDGNDVWLINDIIKEIIIELRENKGPVFIEFLTYRIREHVGPNFDEELGYRTKQEIDLWKNKCPIKLIKNRIEEKYRYSENWLLEKSENFKNELDEIFKWAKAEKYPEKTW